MDTCTVCGVEKSIPEFIVNKTAKRGYTPKCRECYNRIRIRHPFEIRSNVLRPYGLTVQDYDTMYENQKGLCLICEKPFEVLCVDHCHTTNKVRGLLCTSCNIGLGHLKDDTRILQQAIKYLERK